MVRMPINKPVYTYVAAVFLYFTHASLVVSIFFLTLGSFFSLFTNGKVVLNLRIIYFVLFSLVNFFLCMFLFNLTYINYDTLFHLITLLLICFFTILKFERDDISKIINFFLIINLTLIFLGFLFSYVKESIYFVSFSGLNRFQGFFREPSYNAIFCAFIFHLRMYHYDANKKLHKFHVLSLLLLCLSSVSGSGIALFSLVVMFNVKKLRLNRLPVVILFVMILSFFVYWKFEVFEFVINRVFRVFNGNMDESIYIRFFAPLYIIEEFFNVSPLFGVGLSNVGDYILDNYSNFYYLAKYDNLRNTNIDNGFAYWFAGTGLIGLISLVMAIIFRRKSCNNDVVFFVSLLFFTGSIINPIFIYPMLGSWYVAPESD
jgi:hypothetical protein